MGFKFHIVYIDDNDKFKSIDIAAGSLDEALMLFRRENSNHIILISFLG